MDGFYLPLLYQSFEKPGKNVFKKKKKVPVMISPLPFDLLQTLRKEERTVLFFKDIQSGNKMRC